MNIVILLNYIKFVKQASVHGRVHLFSPSPSRSRMSRTPTMCAYIHGLIQAMNVGARGMRIGVACTSYIAFYLSDLVDFVCLLLADSRPRTALIGQSI